MRPNALVPHHLNGREPSYLVVAGIVFTVVTGATVLGMFGPGQLLGSAGKVVDGWRQAPNSVLSLSSAAGVSEPAAAGVSEPAASWPCVVVSARLISGARRPSPACRAVPGERVRAGVWA